MPGPAMVLKVVAPPPIVYGVGRIAVAVPRQFSLYLSGAQSGTADRRVSLDDLSLLDASTPST